MSSHSEESDGSSGNQDNAITAQHQHLHIPTSNPDSDAESFSRTRPLGEDDLEDDLETSSADVNSTESQNYGTVTGSDADADTSVSATLSPTREDAGGPDETISALGDSPSVRVSLNISFSTD